MKCTDAPKGQQCQRESGHDGPHFVTFTEPLACGCLSPADIEALRYLKCFAEEAHSAAAFLHGMEREHIEMSNRALAVLDRLINGASK